MVSESSLESSLFSRVPRDVWAEVCDILHFQLFREVTSDPGGSNHVWRYPTRNDQNAARSTLGSLSLTCRALSQVAQSCLFVKLSFVSSIDEMISTTNVLGDDFKDQQTATAWLNACVKRLEFYRRPHIASRVLYVVIDDRFPMNFFAAGAEQCRQAKEILLTDVFNALHFFGNVLHVYGRGVLLTNPRLQKLGALPFSIPNLSLTDCAIVECAKATTLRISARRASIYEQNQICPMQTLLPLVLDPGELETLWVGSERLILDVLPLLRQAAPCIAAIAKLTLSSLLNNTEPVESQSLGPTLSLFRSLQELDIQQAPFDCSGTEPMDPDTLPSLTTLVCRDTGLPPFSRLPLLKNLVVRSITSLESFIDLIGRHESLFSQLESLKVWLHNDGVSPALCMQLRDACVNLRYLYVNISGDFMVNEAGFSHVPDNTDEIIS